MDETERRDDNEISSKEAYFKSLRIWLNQVNMCNHANAATASSFPYFLMLNYPQLFQPISPITTSLPQQVFNQTPINLNENQVNPIGRNELFDDVNQTPEEVIEHNGGYEYVIAPLWKRFMAELIDIMILFLIKLTITFAIVDLFDIEFGFDIDMDTFRNLDDDYSDILSFTSELLFLEVITKIAVCFYEASWTAQGQGQIGGATPGKMAMGIRILYIEGIVLLEPEQQGFVNIPMRALLYPASNIGYKRALFRAVLKNLIMALLFPMCLLVYLFKNNRTAYDIITHTVVVEDNRVPVLRRR